MSFIKKMTVVYTILLLCLYVVSLESISLTGPCVTMEECPVLNGLIESKRNDYGTRLLLNLLHCYYKFDESYLKCPNSSEINQFMHKIDLLPSQTNCGLEEPKSLISKGERAELKDFPWIALFKYQNTRGQLRYGCHGNLISKRYVLTAAHCVDPIRKDNLLGNISRVVLGEYHIANDTDCFYYSWGSECTDGIKEYSIESYHVHPDFNITSGSADIALIRLDNDAKESAFIKPICLPPVVLHILTDEVMWIGGWGETANFDFNTIKMKAKFKKLRNDICDTSVMKVTKKHICAGSIAEAKTCPGDSGGPLMALRLTGYNYRYYLAGVLSQGPRCNSYSKFSIFTRVSSYLGWIVETIH